MHLSIIKEIIKNKKIQHPIQKKKNLGELSTLIDDRRRARNIPIHTQNSIKERYKILHLVKNLMGILLLVNSKSDIKICIYCYINLL